MPFRLTANSCTSERQKGLAGFVTEFFESTLLEMRGMLSSATSKMTFQIGHFVGSTSKVRFRSSGSLLKLRRYLLSNEWQFGYSILR